MSGQGGDRVQLTAAWLAERYVVRRWTTERIAQVSGWSSQYVRDALRAFGIPLRATGVHSGLREVDRDRLAGWLAEGASVATVADRTGYSPAGVRKLCKRWGLTLPPAPPRSAPGPDDPLVAELISLYQQDQLSLASIAARYGRSSDWVETRLRGAGQQIRPAGRRNVVDPEQVRRLLDAGLPVSQIAAQLRRSEWAVLSVMNKRGWTGPPRRPRGPTRSGPVAPTEAVLRRLYVQEQRSIADIAATVGSTTARIDGALKAAGIPRRSRLQVHGFTELDPDLLKRHAEQGHTRTRIAAALGTSTHRVQTALRRHGIALQQTGPVPPAPVDPATLTDLYVLQRLDDRAIAARFQVPTWRITQRRRELGIRRPPAAPSRTARGVLPAPETLRRLYLEEQQTLAQIGRTYRTAAPKVRAALDAAGIPVRPRTSRASRTDLDPDLLRKLYQHRQWTTPHIAAHLHTTVALVLRTLHDHNIPVRAGGPLVTSGPADIDIDPRLTALYRDPNVTALLRRHRIPRRHQPGTITQRFPTAHRPTAAFLRTAYINIGLTASHIEQLTGYPADQILDDLHRHGIAVRPASSFSPWYLRTYPPHQT